MKNPLNKLNLTLVFLTSSLFGVTSLYWSNVCVKGGCSYELVDTFLYPLYYSSLALLVFFGFFLLLPAHYFINWLKKIFSWAFPISVLIVMSNVSGGGGPFPIFAREVIIMLSVFFGAVTLLYVLWHWHTSKN